MSENYRFYISVEIHDRWADSQPYRLFDFKTDDTKETLTHFKDRIKKSIWEELKKRDGGA